jgi:hypothetical protein
MKLGLRSGSLSLALLLGIAGAGCGDDDDTMVDAGTDAGTDGGGTDSGPPQDTGPVDTGVDAPEPVEQAFVRVAHLSPNTGDVRLCIDLRVGGTRVGGLPPLPTDRTIPFRGISPYINLDIVEGVTYRVKAFVVASIADPVDCTMDSPLFVDVDSADLEVDGYYTGAAIGFSPEEGGALPSVCPDDSMPPEFDAPCPEALGVRLEVYEDDSTLDAAASKIRILHAIPNAPAVDVCYDDDPEDETPPVAIASSLAFGSASDYFESAAAITSGVVSVHAHVPGMSCVNSELTTLAQLPVPAGFEFIRSVFPEDAQPNIPTTFELNRITTVFAEGIASAPEPHPMAPAAFVPWQDQPAVTAGE